MLTFLHLKPSITKSYAVKQLPKALTRLCDRFPNNFLGNQILPGIGYITQLWRDSKDIEFVKQSIGHQKLDTTSAYVTNLSDQERQDRIADV